MVAFADTLGVVAFACSSRKKLGPHATGASARGILRSLMNDAGTASAPAASKAPARARAQTRLAAEECWEAEMATRGTPHRVPRGELEARGARQRHEQGLAGRAGREHDAAHRGETAAGGAHAVATW